ncbi:AAA family ATPase [Teredinibacter waterburyi]|uniref:AAA family ATPase n=1 Tax=Teredinibacter waterburyi TaxID=1500538 RepID=UPI00165EFADD|nr:MoxR family ATPase [Teredinibacter waterburyi]
MNNTISALTTQIGTVLLGKEPQVKLALACLFAKGHLLIEDLPGMGKTTLAQCLSRVLGLAYQRVQFTSDLLPGDILGSAVYEREKSQFHFHPGPVFTQVLLADEINRSTPKTQSALLEAMEERQVTVEGETRPLPEPFFVIATQNPLSQAGTYPLPESQLDRFLMRISLGYPNRKAERQLFEGVDPRARLAEIEPVIDLPQLQSLQAQVQDVKATQQLLDYLQRMVEFTRNDESFTYGLSPRGAMAWLRAAKAWALIDNREYLLPDDLQAVMSAVVGHRVRGVHSHSVSGQASPARSLVDHLLNSVSVIETR